MKIALLGYGKMGQAIEQIAIKRGHDIVIKTSSASGYDITTADIAIDFSVPKAAFQNISNCITHGVPVISGTTGWLNDYDKAVALCNTHNGGFIYASNFSLGVNLFFKLNRDLSKLMEPFKEYAVAVEEIHHTQKLDAPSGTAISLANAIIDNNNSYTQWQLNNKATDAIPIIAKRIPEVPGTHTIAYSSDIDTIEIKHTAHSRQGFALGAVIAAEWLLGKSGVFTMNDVLNIS